MITIAPATDVDDALVDAFARLIPQLDPTLAPPTRGQLEAIVASENVAILVARTDDGAVLGALTLVSVRIPTGAKAWIEDVVVDSAARGQGLGDKLSRAALELARERGASAVYLTSRASREAANRLYQRIGFEPRETNVYRYGL